MIKNIYVKFDSKSTHINDQIEDIILIKKKIRQLSHLASSTIYVTVIWLLS